MTIPTFTDTRELYDAQHHLPSLHAFALGAQHPDIHALISHHPDALQTLEGQERLASVAHHHWQRAQYHSAIRHTLNRHANALYSGHNLCFEDIELHRMYPALPLMKYYAALQKGKQSVAKDQLWSRHLVYCRNISLALHEIARASNSSLSYNAHSLTVSTPSKKECVCFHYQAAAQCYHVSDWRYFLLPMPWE